MLKENARVMTSVFINENKVKALDIYQWNGLSNVRFIENTDHVE